jgi:hypothetical protein
MWGGANTDRKQEAAYDVRRWLDPVGERLAPLFCNLKLDGPFGLLLLDDSATRNPGALSFILNAKLDQIAGPGF